MPLFDNSEEIKNKRIQERVDVEERISKEKKDAVTYGRINVPDKTKMRNLKQYVGMTDEEFDEMYAKKMVGVTVNREFENRIQRKIDEFSVDYDLEDLNSNDRLQLRALAQALITLEDFENISYNIRAEGLSIDNILLLDKVARMLTDIRDSVSKLQDDLKISRKVRKSDKEQSVKDTIDDLKKKAKEFYEARMSYILCPKCNMLLGTFWVLYHDEKRNKISLVCNRKLDNGEICGEKVIVIPNELGVKQTNKPEVLPESMV